MKAAHIPKNEAERLAVLHRYQILDTPEEPSFDGITWLAAQILGVPISLVSIVDTDRQWFKSHHGLDVRETPRDVSFCGHVVANDAALEVEDATVDDRFHDNPLVTGDPRVRFYAAVPLRGEQGHVLGTLCAIDHVPRRLTAVQRQHLDVLAQQVVAQLDLRRQARTLAEEREALSVVAERLRMSEARQAAVFETMGDGVLVLERDSRISFCNPAAARLLGRTSEELLDRDPKTSLFRVVSEDGTTVPPELLPSRIGLGAGVLSKDVILGAERPSGEIAWMSVSARPIMDPGETTPRALVMMFHDIGAQREAERKVRDALARRETMLREVHHRVKNNLQIIVALLFFARKRVADVAQRQVFDELETRLHGMILVHEKLYGSGGLDGIEVGAFFRSLLDHVREVHGRDPVDLDLQTCELELPFEQMLPCSLLVSELVTNAFKYAFPGGRTGRIVVGVTKEEGWVMLTVSDDGIGLPEGALPHGTAGFGLRMARKLADQLGGMLVVEPGVGTRFAIRFPKRELLS